MYASVDDIRARTTNEINENICVTLIEDASTMVDVYAKNASDENKKLVVCRMVLRALPQDNVSFPIGASQGTMSALGYSQTWTLSGGTTGELYITKVEKRLLGVGSMIGSHSPIEDL